MVRRTAFLLAVLALMAAGSATAGVRIGEPAQPEAAPHRHASAAEMNLPGPAPGVGRLLDGLPEPLPPDVVPAPPAPLPPHPERPGSSPSREGAPKPPSSSSPPASSAAGPTPTTFAGVPDGVIAGFATGTVLHADAVHSGKQRLSDVEVAFSGATFTSSRLDVPVLNEMSRAVAPTLPASTGFGRGSGLEVGLLQAGGQENQLVLDDAEAQAPPSAEPVTHQVGPVSLDPLAFASLLRGQAHSGASPTCEVGRDLGFGLGYAADVDLLETRSDGTTPGFDSPVIATAAADPVRSVSQSASRTRLVRQSGPGRSAGRLGITSETRQTIAPVTFLSGTSSEFTVEIAGEWVLQATADGASASLSYGPRGVSPETAVVRILDRAGVVLGQVTTQQVLSSNGVELIVAGGVAEIVIGEPPRAIGGAPDSAPTRTAEKVAAAVDIVRMRLLDGDANHLTDVRIGHLETAVAIPEGGIPCPAVEIAIRADPVQVIPGEEFVWSLAVTNPGNCLFDTVSVVADITVTPGVRYTVLSTDASPPAGPPGGPIVWNDIGPIRQGQTKDLRARIRVERDSPPGRFTNGALVTGICRRDGRGDDASTGVPIYEARVTLDEPAVGIVPASFVDRAATGGATPPGAHGPGLPEPSSVGLRSGGMLARTGVQVAFLLGLGLLAIGGVLRTAGADCRLRIANRGHRHGGAGRVARWR